MKDREELKELMVTASLGAYLSDGGLDRTNGGTVLLREEAIGLLTVASRPDGVDLLIQCAYVSFMTVSGTASTEPVDLASLTAEEAFRSHISIRKAVQ